MPVRYCNLPLSSQLAITVWDLAGPGKAVPFGGTTVSMFEKDKWVVTFASNSISLHLHFPVTSRRAARSASSGLVLKPTV